MNSGDKKSISGKKVLRFAQSAAAFTLDSAAGVVTTVFKILGSVLLMLIIAGMLFSIVFAYYVKTTLTPSLDISLEDFKLSESSRIMYQNTSGEWAELTSLSGTKNRKWVDYDEIPSCMEHALVAIEDKRFYDHKGVDWYRTSGAFVKMFATMQNSFGGSTITQQLIKNLTGNDEVTVKRKLGEIFGALELEKKYDKQEIIEWYMNAVYFGEGCYGVQAAAETYFGKDVGELSVAEAASIVGITNMPTAYDPFYDEAANKERQETILREMYEQGYLNYNQYVDAVNEQLVFARTPGEVSSQKIYSYYEEVVIDDVIADLMDLKGISSEAARTLVYNGGYTIYCCIDPVVQAAVDAVYTDLTKIPRTTRSSQQLQSGIVVMNPYDGRILALSGGVGEKNRNFPLNRATGSQRPAGSSFKPVASYGPAMEYGLITPDTLVNDSGYISLAGTNWYPENDGGGHYGIVTIYRALTLSLNTVSAQIIDKLSPQASYDFLTTRLGFTSLVPDDISYAPLALGQMTNGVTVREMAQAYCAFGNDGVFTYSKTYDKVIDSAGNIVIDNQSRTIQAFSPNTAHCMTYCMKNVVNNGTGTEAQLWTTPVAGKTGTSTDYQDRWFCGLTKYYCAAVWTGYDQPERIYTSGNPAARIWKAVMQPLHEGLAYSDFDYPYLGANTGIFDIYDPEIYDEYGNYIDYG